MNVDMNQLLHQSVKYYIKLLIDMNSQNTTETLPITFTPSSLDTSSWRTSLSNQLENEVKGRQT